MPIRFPTEAANDPGMKKPSAPDAAPPEVGADGTPRGRADGTPEPPDKRNDTRPNDSKAGKDINQPGYVRERDTDRER